MSDIELLPANVLGEQARAEIDTQIATAKQYPREISKSKEVIESLALADANTAATMFYALPRAGKTVEGPSVRLAEVIVYAWGNMRAESRIVDISHDFVTAQGTAADLQNNTAHRSEVKRRITNKQGKRFGEDMIQTTCNAACKIAFREAVFGIVPRVMFEPIWQQAKQMAVGDVQSVQQSFDKALRYFTKLGISEERVREHMGNPPEITKDHIAQLRGLSQALSEGATTLEDAFPVEQPPAAETPEFDADAFRAMIDYSGCNTHKGCDTKATGLLKALGESSAPQDVRAQFDMLINAECDKRQKELNESK